MAVINLNKNSEFLKNILQAMNDIDLLNSASFEDSYRYLLEDLAAQLEHVVSIFAKFKTKSIAGVKSLTDRKLETQNKEFLDKLEQYVTGVTSAYNNRGVRLAKLLTSYNIRIAQSDEYEKVQQTQKKIAESVQSFRQAIEKVGALSHKRLNEARERNLLHLEKYQKLFAQLQFLETLDLDKAIELLQKRARFFEKGDIFN